MFIDGDEEEVRSSVEFTPTALISDLFQAPEQLVQYQMYVTCKWRLSALTAFLQDKRDQKVLVFFSSRNAVDLHHALFQKTKYFVKKDIL